MQENNKTVKNIQSVHRALDILEQLAESGAGYKLSHLAQKCGLNKTTTFHLLKTLEARGYVEQSYDTQIYKPGMKLVETADAIYQNFDIFPIAAPYMDKILASVNETVTLYYFMRVNDYYAGVCVLQKESTQPLKFTALRGSRIPLHATAAGKVRLLGYSGEMLEEQLSKTPLVPYTPFTTTDADTLKQQLVTIRKDGFCIEREEYLPGICSIAVPLFKYTGRVIYSLSVSVPTVRASDAYMNSIAQQMMHILSIPSNHPDFIFRSAPIPPFSA